MWLWQCVFLHEVLCNEMHPCTSPSWGGSWVGIHVKSTLSCFCVGLMAEHCKSQWRVKKFLFSALVSINGSALVQEVEVVPVSVLQFFAIVSPTFMGWCWNPPAFPALISPAVLPPGPLAMVEEPRGHLRQSQTGNLLSICSFNAESKSNRPVWAFPSDDPAQGAQAGVLCQPSKGGCDPSEKYPKQGLIYWWVLHVGQEQLPVRRNLPWRLQ